MTVLTRNPLRKC